LHVCCRAWGFRFQVELTKESKLMSARATQWSDRVRATWDERAPWWDEMSEANARTEDRKIDLDRVVAGLGLEPGSQLLDAGCGTGQFALAFAMRGCRVTGIDIAPAMIDRARRHARADNVDIEWRVGSIEQLVETRRYDAIHARVVLQFVENVPETLKRFRRALKPNGRLFVSVPGALSPIYQNSWKRFFTPQGVNANFMAPWELRETLQALDWEILESWGEFGLSRPEGEENATPVHIASLPEPLQQAAATTWGFIAE
jgi:2-polyprenyl-3-methyl-5-hydroxy-6-metoxy-1,4-benzoquinol methylase